MSHHFSRVTLRARVRDSDLLRRLSRFEEAYRDHSLVWRLFPGDGMPRDFVFRQGIDASGAIIYYIISRRAPKDVDGLFQVQSKLYQPQVEEGAFLRFDLRANPTVNRRGKDGVSRRHDVLMDAKRLMESPQDVRMAMERAGNTWLSARAPSWGLAVEDGSVLQTGYRQHRLAQKGKSIEFSSLDYSGTARVADPQALQRALLDGVGHARGFGCGLLLVKRLA